MSPIDETEAPTVPPTVSASHLNARSLPGGTQTAAAAGVPPVVVVPGPPGTSSTTIVYVNPPAAQQATVGPSGGAGSPLGTRRNASLLTAYALFFVLGWTGMHQVYLGNTLRGVSYIFTFSWLTLGLWIDLFTLPGQVRRVNTERMLGLR